MKAGANPYTVVTERTRGTLAVEVIAVASQRVVRLRVEEIAGGPLVASGRLRRQTLNGTHVYVSDDDACWTIRVSKKVYVSFRVELLFLACHK